MSVPLASPPRASREAAFPRGVPAAAAVAAEGLTKVYRNGQRALGGLDLRIGEGEVFCLVGPNGAGKTTLLGILSTRLAPSGGRARILGYDLERQFREIRRLLAVVPQDAGADPYLKVREHIGYYLVARGMDRRAARRATEEVAERLGLGDRLGDAVGQLSGGMRRRVLLAMALASGGRLLLLDEPTSGLDLLARRRTWDVLAELKGERTLLLTTHSMEEAEALADRVGILHQGRLVAEGTPRELRALAPGPQKVVLAEDSIPLAEVAALGQVQPYAGKWAVFPRDGAALRRLLDLAVRRRVEASVLNSSLEDVFVHLVRDDGPRIALGELA